MIFRRNDSVMIKNITFLSFGQIYPCTNIANCESGKLLHLCGLNIQQFVYDEWVKDYTRLIIVKFKL